MILYTIPNCPWCEVLKSRLDSAKLEYKEVNDMKVLKEKKLLSAPQLELEDGRILNYQKSIEWLNSR